MILISVITLVGIVLLSAYYLIARIRSKEKLKMLISLKNSSIFAMAIILNVGLIILSQFIASTPPIVDENGNTPQNSIAELQNLS